MSTFAELRESVLTNATLSTAMFAKDIVYTRHNGSALSITGHCKYEHDLKLDESTGLEVYVERVRVKLARSSLAEDAVKFLPHPGDSIVIDGDGERPYVFAFMSETRTAWIRVAFERFSIRTQGISRR